VSGPPGVLREVDLGRLFRLNRSVPDAAVYAEIERLEADWIVPLAASVEAAAPEFGSRAELMRALENLLAQEEADLPPTHDFLAREATLDQFKVVAAQFAVDGLTESQSLLAVVPRLPHRASMAVFRVLIDEFGCGNVDRVHFGLYKELLTELGLPTDLAGYLPGALPEVYAYVDLFYWLAARAPRPDYFVGAYAYFESSVLYAFRCLGAAADRLGLRHARYYSEHLYIDNYHSKQMKTAIRELDAEQGVDYRKVWTGIQLTSQIAGAAMDAAIELSRTGG
jgi:Iron-containing redox enzyme